MANKPEAGDSILVTAAKKIGAVAGKIAAIAGAESPAKTAPVKPAKFEKKMKSRLPRKEKKAGKKKAARLA